MHVVLLSPGALTTVVKKPNDLFRHSDGANCDLITNADFVDKMIEAVMKKVRAITASGVGRTNPDGPGGPDAGLGPPRQLLVIRDADLAGKLIIPGAGF